jgi:hypothetical protein
MCGQDHGDLSLQVSWSVYIYGMIQMKGYHVDEVMNSE